MSEVTHIPNQPLFAPPAQKKRTAVPPAKAAFDNELASRIRSKTGDGSNTAAGCQNIDTRPRTAAELDRFTRFHPPAAGKEGAAIFPVSENILTPPKAASAADPAAWPTGTDGEAGTAPSTTGIKEAVPVVRTVVRPAQDPLCLWRRRNHTASAWSDKQKS